MSEIFTCALLSMFMLSILKGRSCFCESARISWTFVFCSGSSFNRFTRLSSILCGTLFGWVMTSRMTLRTTIRVPTTPKTVPATKTRSNASAGLNLFISFLISRQQPLVGEFVDVRRQAGWMQGGIGKISRDAKADDQDRGDGQAREKLFQLVPQGGQSGPWLAAKRGPHPRIQFLRPRPGRFIAG